MGFLTESMATQKQIEANRKNGKRGGRKPGTLNEATLEKIAVGKQYAQKVLQKADLLFKKKLQLACGQGFLYKIEKYYEGRGDKKVLKRKPPKLCTEIWEFEEGLEQAIEGGMDFEDFDQTYYFFTTKEPNNQAIEDLLDRGLGRVATAIKAEDEEGNTQPITGFVIIRDTADKKKQK